LDSVLELLHGETIFVPAGVLDPGVVEWVAATTAWRLDIGVVDDAFGVFQAIEALVDIVSISAIASAVVPVAVAAPAVTVSVVPSPVPVPGPAAASAAVVSIAALPLLAPGGPGAAISVAVSLAALLGDGLLGVLVGRLEVGALDLLHRLGDLDVGGGHVVWGVGLVGAVAVAAVFAAVVLRLFSIGNELPILVTRAAGSLPLLGLFSLPLPILAPLQTFKRGELPVFRCILVLGFLTGLHLASVVARVVIRAALRSAIVGHSVPFHALDIVLKVLVGDSSWLLAAGGALPRHAGI
jgi:hypothetical protein